MKDFMEKWGDLLNTWIMVHNPPGVNLKVKKISVYRKLKNIYESGGEEALEAVANKWIKEIDLK